MLAFDTYRDIVNKEILGKAGPLWGKSIQRLRDRSIALAFPPEIFQSINVYRNPATGYIYIDNGSGSKDSVSSLFDKKDDFGSKAISIDEIEKLHKLTTELNRSFYRDVMDTLKTGRYNKKEIANQLRRYFEDFISPIYKEAKKTLNLISDKFTELSKKCFDELPGDNQHPDEHSINYAKYIQFIVELFTPSTHPDSVYEPILFDEIEEALTSNGKPNPQRFSNYSEFTTWLTRTMPTYVNDWQKEMAEGIEIWWQQAQESYKKVIQYFDHDVSRN